jgi:YYY domain-containing protein
MENKSVHASQNERKWAWVYDLLLIVVLLAGVYFRLVGMAWDEDQHPHPDERFLTMVETALQPKVCADASVPLEACPPEQKRWMSAGDYFNTAKSTLNPHNRGYGFFVYGTLPMFIVRYVAEWVNQTGYDQINMVGRALSTLADLGSIFFLYLIVARLYGRRVALLAAAFSSLAVLQIQQSHYFTVDTFTNFFMFLALYFGVEIAVGEWRMADGGWQMADGDPSSTLHASRFTFYVLRFIREPLLWLSLGFGLALGMAAASKLNAAVMAIVLPAAFAVRYFRANRRQETEEYSSPVTRHSSLITGHLSLNRIIIFLVIGALASIIAFRLFQPYAFSGPGFFGLKPNPAWIANIQEQRTQANGDADVPFALQWARRSHLFSFENLTVWGLGLPLGILAWAGFLWMGWRILKGEWRQHLLLWGWTALYFIWQSLQFNPTMRYQLPIYPLLAMMAAYFVFQVAGCRLKVKRANPNPRPLTFNLQPLAILLGVSTLIATAAWAFAFTRIYTRTETRIAASRWIYQNIPGPINLRIQAPDGTTYQQPLPFPYAYSLQAGAPYNYGFVPHVDGMLTGVTLGRAVNVIMPTASQTLSLVIASAPEPQPDQVLGSATLTADFAPQKDLRGEAYALTLDHPVLVTKGQTYFLHLATTGSALALSGAAPANETEWDMGLPFRLDGYDGYGGIYNGNLNLEIYWDDNADKLVRFQTTLDQADYIFISSNRQWASVTRIPERYPLTTSYYRELIGCPPDKDLIWCYNVARPGMFEGNLGFDLVTVFESFPTLGPLTINDQFAEEAFTVYDHSKVLIFQKRPDYDPAHVQAVLGAVDLTHVVHLTPRQAGKYKELMLSSSRLAVEQAGGTWSELFDRAALYNRYPVIGLLLWYVTIFALGLFTYPIVRAALPGLSDRGYPLARIGGMLLWAWFAWMAGSAGIPYSRLTIGVALVLVALIGGILAYRQRQELRAEWNSKWKYFLLIEALFLAFFLLDLFIRIGNPDLWHDPNGGERPMDFSYFNAVLKSTTFPPYDPWFAGGYINYYYFGYVIVGTPVKLLGIVPSIAYNFILPTLFAMVALGAFSVGYNLVNKDEGGRLKAEKFILHPSSFISGLAASSAMLLLGNLGIVRLFYRGFMCLAAPSAQLGNFSVHDCIIAPGVPPVDKANLIARLWWTIKGFFLSLSGLSFPLSNREWMMTPSRALPDASGSPITEFPLMTFLWSDLHAHMMAFSLTVLVIAWALSVLLAKARWKSRMDAFLGFFLAGLAIGALKPTNTWDFYTYLALGVIVLAYAVWRYADVERIRLPLLNWTKRLLLTVGAVIALVGLSMLLYQPFTHWFAQSYNSVEAWTGGRSNISSYFVHWGVFLFFIVSWMSWEMRQWMAETPVSALRKLRPYRDLIIAALILIFFTLVVQQAWVMSSTQNVPWKGITVLWLALPLAVWAAVLIFRPGMSDGKRLILFMVGTSLLLTMVVEIIVLRGDVGRMNTVFKFYVQAWIMLGISAAAAFGWLLSEIPKWLPRWRTAWNLTATVLLTCAALYLLVAGMAKIRDRMNPAAPHTLDSMTYMAYAQYFDFGISIDLSEDYRAIRWMQENVQGSPVIVEANCPEYRWCSRFTIYTGLPGVVGWNWHQRQQRALMANQVWDRIGEITTFYTTTDPAAAQAFLKKYNVRYIVVGKLERAEYIGEGLIKFDQYNGKLWKEVYRDGQTVIYEVPEGYEVLP